MKYLLPKDVYAHWRVAKLCEAMALEVYDAFAINNEWYKVNKSKRKFVRAVAPTLVEEARQILSMTLQDPTLSDNDKSQIYDALMYDRGFPRPRGVWQAN